MKAGRFALSQDWAQGDYLAGSVLDETDVRSETEKLEALSKRLLSKVSDRSLCLSWSGGIDSLATIHLCYQMGLTDIPVMFSHTSSYYPALIEYVGAMADRMGFDQFERREADSYGWDWVLADPETRMFPPKNVHMNELKQTFQTHIESFIDEVDAELHISGARGEDNSAPTYLYDQAYCDEDQYQFNLIRDWETRHVVAYLDKYSLPIRYAYGIEPNPSDAWHRYLMYDGRGAQRITEANIWWLIHETSVREGYTAYWERITDHFPRGETLAREYAEQLGKPFTPTSAGREHGADTRPVVPEWFSP